MKHEFLINMEIAVTKLPSYSFRKIEGGIVYERAIVGDGLHCTGYLNRPDTEVQHGLYYLHEKVERGMGGMKRTVGLMQDVPAGHGVFARGVVVENNEIKELVGFSKQKEDEMDFAARLFMNFATCRRFFTIAKK